MKFEYKVLNLSEVENRNKGDYKFNLITLLNEYGQQGYEVVFKLNQSAYLMKRTILDEKVQGSTESR